MRWLLAGILLLICSPVLFAETKGEVESIGFGGYIRPDTWCPMLIRLRPGTLQAGTYQIQVEQHDRDDDTQIFTRTITVNSSDQAREQRFWMYFLPETVNGQLADRGNSLRDINQSLKVWLCNENGRQLEPLPVTSTVQNIDANLSHPIGRKFILAVSDELARPQFMEFGADYGVSEDVAMISVRPDDLPESSLGYDGVDAVVWMSGDAAALTRAGAERLPALEKFVKQGGKLIVTQPADRSKIEPLAALLPIEIKQADTWTFQMQNRDGLAPLSNWAAPVSVLNIENPWKQKHGPFKVAKLPASAVKPGALVVATTSWNDDASGTSPTTAPAEQTPYLVRWPVGLGQVTWVAQNLGDPSLTQRIQSGWIGVWGKVLDLKDAPAMPIGNGAAPTAFQNNETVDLGKAPLPAIEHAARGAALVLVAVGFFILYWVLSGPIAFFVLASKKRAGWNWPIFGSAALVATLITVGVVKIVLGAEADIHHITFVRWTPDQPAVVESLFGVYLTKSGSVPITLTKTDPAFISYVSAFNPHPYIDKGGQFVGKEKYTIAVPEAGSADNTEVFIPFRSTLKKMQARWVGQLPGLGGSATLVDETTIPTLKGKLTNATGHDLVNVYFVFQRQPTEFTNDSSTSSDYIYYLPKWTKDAPLNLDTELTAKTVATSVGSKAPDGHTIAPGQNRVVSGRLTAQTKLEWNDYWYHQVVSNVNGEAQSLNDDSYSLVFPLLSVYDRLAVSKASAETDHRYDLLRRGARKYDMSQCVSAGQLVVLASDAANNAGSDGKSPLPIPIEVDHEQVQSTGVTFYQFALPLSRPVAAPTTQPEK